MANLARGMNLLVDHAYAQAERTRDRMLSGGMFATEGKNFGLVAGIGVVLLAVVGVVLFAPDVLFLSSKKGSRS